MRAASVRKLKIRVDSFGKTVRIRTSIALREHITAKDGGSMRGRDIRLRGRFVLVVAA